MAKDSGARAPRKRSFFAYRVLRRLLRIATQIFFRNIEVVGLESLPNPNRSAVVFCGNHPNSLLDPVLITAWCGRITHFAAKDVLFAVPVLGYLLKLMGAVPIRRRMDHGGGKMSNEDAFRDLTQVLLDGGAMGIFPEGVSHDASQLVPLKTGAARIALGAAAKGCTVPIFLVPVGLVYFTRNRFRSSVLVQFGEPIEIPVPEAESPPSKEEVHELTGTLDEQIRALTINAETWENVWVLDGVRRLYQPPHIDLTERARLARVFNQGYPQVAKEGDVVELYDEVRGYLLRLDADNLNDRMIAKGLGPSQIALRVIAHLTLLFVSLPLFLIGAPVFIPIGLLLKIAGVAVSPRSDTVASTKFLLGFFGLTALYLAGVVWAFWTLGWWQGLITAALIPASGGATIHVIARLNAIRHLFLTTIRVFTLRVEIRALSLERVRLAAKVQLLVDKYRDSVI
jgi:glycerol-3-phosphate O-acyltransferase/dihydroxyacetone phosphate acyltransferase